MQDLSTRSSTNVMSLSLVLMRVTIYKKRSAPSAKPQHHGRIARVITLCSVITFPNDIIRGRLGVPPPFTGDTPHQHHCAHSVVTKIPRKIPIEEENEKSEEPLKYR